MPPLPPPTQRRGGPLAANPKLAADRQAGHRDNAACAAAPAASGQGEDKPATDEASQVGFSKQALGWLEPELSTWKRVPMTIEPGNKEAVAQTLTHRKGDADLAGIRDDAALAKLPEQERAAFKQLWTDVDGLRTRMEGHKEAVRMDSRGHGLRRRRFRRSVPSADATPQCERSPSIDHHLHDAGKIRPPRRYRVISPRARRGPTTRSAIVFAMQLCVPVIRNTLTMDVARSLFKTGRQVYSAGDLTGGLRLFEEQRDIAARLEAIDPSHAARFLRALGLARIGVVIDEMWKTTESLEAYREAMEIVQKLAHDQPAVANFQRVLAILHDNRGAFVARMGKPKEALEEYGKGLAILQQLVDGDPANIRFKAAFANVQENIGQVLNRLKRSAEALTATEAGLAIRVKLMEEDPGNNDHLDAIAASYGSRGMVRIGAGRPAEAAADLRHALELMAKVPPQRPWNRYWRSQILAVLAGLGADARSGVTKAEAAAFADQSVAGLAEVIKTGWVLSSDLKEPEFDAVRDRPDFEKLLSELETKAQSK